VTPDEAIAPVAQALLVDWQAELDGMKRSPHMIQINAAAATAANDGVWQDAFPTSKWPQSQPWLSARL